jgi:hypothetical protein
MVPITTSSCSQKPKDTSTHLEFYSDCSQSFNLYSNSKSESTFHQGNAKGTYFYDYLSVNSSFYFSSSFFGMTELTLSNGRQYKMNEKTGNLSYG